MVEISKYGNKKRQGIEKKKIGREKAREQPLNQG